VTRPVEEVAADLRRLVETGSFEDLGALIRSPDLRRISPRIRAPLFSMLAARFASEELSLRAAMRDGTAT
jgi:hypothetical protein